MPQEPEPIPLPDQKQLRPEGLSNRAKRYMFFIVMGVILLVVIANMIGGSAIAPALQPKTNTQQQQNPTASQLRDKEYELAQQQAALIEKTAQDAARLHKMQQQVGVSGNNNLSVNDQLASMQDAQARLQASQPGIQTAARQQDSQKAQLEAEQRALERKALFADNVVRQDRAPSSQTTTSPAQLVPAVARAAPEHTERPTGTAAMAPAVATTPEHKRKPLDFDPAAKTYWLPEGTVLEGVLTNRLEGSGVGPVNVMLTADVYLPGTRLVVIPQGARVLGEASKVSATGQQRLAVAFHRVIVPGLHEYSIPLDSKPPALGQAGEGGLHDKVDNHYSSIFGASLAIGAIGGLAQIGNSQSEFGFDPTVQLRNGITGGMAQTSERILDRFLNRLPTLTIREGTRTKILLTDDLQLPAYQQEKTL